MGLLALLVSCAANGPTPGSTLGAAPLRIDGVVFENRARTAVDSIQLLVPATGNFVSCGRIAAGALCSARFPDVDYRGHPVEVKWMQGGAEWTTGVVGLSVSGDVEAAGLGVVRVVVVAPGSAGIVLVAEDPGAMDGALRRP